MAINNVSSEKPGSASFQIFRLDYKKGKVFESVYYQVSFWVLILFPLVSTVNRILPISPNRILIGCYALAYLFFDFLSKPHRWFYYFAVLYLMCAALLTTYFAKGHETENLGDAIYFSMTVFVVMQMCDRNFLKAQVDLANKFRIVIHITLYLALLIFGISYFFASSFEVDHAFRGFTTISHAVAATAILMGVLALCGKIKDPIPYLGSSVLVMLSKARTFLFPLALILVLYVFLIAKTKKWRILLLLLGSALCIGVFPFTPMYDKFLETLHGFYRQEDGIIRAITNFRSVLWKQDLEAFFSSNFLNQIFGNTFSFVRSVNEAGGSNRLWAHDDFIDCVCSLGYFGLLFYFFVFICGVKSCPGRANKVCLVFYWLLPAFFNGFYMYFPLVLGFLVLSTYFFSGSLEYQRLKIPKCMIQI